MTLYKGGLNLNFKIPVLILNKKALLSNDKRAIALINIIKTFFIKKDINQRA